MKLLTLFLLFFLNGNSSSWGADLSSVDGTPVEIIAEDGIEWNSKESKISALGKAIIKKGDMEIKSDSLEAFYRSNNKGNPDIYKINAKGNVVFSSDEGKAIGNTANYDLDQQLITLKGNPAKLERKNEKITAHGDIEYWQKKRVAIAKENAVVEKQGKKLRADTIKAYFSTKGIDELEKAEALGNVTIETDKEKITGNSGTYSPKKSIATLSGSVKIIQGKSELNGDYAEVDLKTGISRLKTTSKNTNKVQGSFFPEKKKKKK